jgi:signal transduction histidine kinase
MPVPTADASVETFATSRPVRVLLVEDDEDDVVLTRQMLAEIDPAGFDVHWVSDYHQGLEALCSGHHDVCLVDYRLGPHDGVEFVRQAVARECRAPTILLTGLGDHAVDVAAMNAGAADFLNKSELRAADLERAIRYAMQHRRAQEQRIKLLTEQAARARLEAANRAKDDFLAALSHELRTPLTPVLIAVQEMEQEAGLPEPLRETVGLVRRNIELEARLIDDLLDLTRVAHRKIKIRREVVDVHAELRHAVDTCGHGQVHGKRIEFTVATGATNHHVIGDPARLQQVFWNLLKNAIKFTPDGGRIDVRTVNPPRDGANANDRVVIEVRDTGIGIEPEALPRIFNAFEQADPSITRHFGGLGLGLAICKALVELHGGTLCAGSEGKGRGATFTVNLPAVAAPQPRPGAETEPGAGAAHRSAPPAPAVSGRILLVEDHADTRRMMAKLLERDGHCVTPAESVAKALQVAGGQPFDLVISDIGLPDASGLDLMKRLKELGPIKGIALSGYGMEQDIRLSEQAGFAEHLIKPVDLKKLRDTVVRLLTRPTPETAVVE